MSKAQSRGNAALFVSKNTDHPSPGEKSQRRRGARKGFVDGIVNGERVLMHEPTAPRESEKGIEIRIRVALAAAGVMVMKHNIDRRSPFGTGLGIGVSDLICVVPPYGRFLGIEVKRPDTRGKVRAAQERWLSTVLRFGGVTGIAATIEEALALVEQARRLP